VHIAAREAGRFLVLLAIARALHHETRADG